MSLSYDKIPYNHQIYLDLPFRYEGGLITHDVSKLHHIADGTGHNPSWDTVWPLGPSDLAILDFNGIAEYLEIPGADSQNLDFTGDFTLAAWVYPVYTALAMVLMCRNTTFVCGWCMYLYNNPNPAIGRVLSLRTSQGGGPPDHTECYAQGFPDSVWQLVGFSRDSAGQTAICYKDGAPLTTIFNGVPLLDPVACGAANKLLIGVQDLEAISFYSGKMWRPRAWPRQLSADEWKAIFEAERHWLGV